MRVLHVIDSIDPASGGPTAVVLRLGCAQAALGHEVHIVGSRFPERRGVLEAYVSDLNGADALRMHVVDRPAGRLERFRGAAFAHAVEAVTGFDVMHLHGVWDTTLVRSAAVARARGATYVMTPHGMLDGWSMRQGALKKRLMLAAMVRRMFARAGAIQALNTHERESIEAFGFGSRVVVVGNGVDLEEVGGATPAGFFRGTVPGLGDSAFVLFLSRLHYKKGLDILADAWVEVARQMPELRLVVAGPSEDGSARAFEKRIVEAGLRDTVFVTGPIYGTRKTAAFREAVAFVLPSRQEGFSIAITEALALGTAVVITRECHFPEVREVGAGFVTSLDSGEVASSILRLARDSALRSSMGDLGARLVRERYTWDRIGEQMLGVYEDCLSSL